MLGAQNEYLIFPILELIKKEIRRNVETGALDGVLKDSYNRYTNINEGDTNINKTIIYSDIESLLNSNDYVVDLYKEDPANPEWLTGVRVIYEKKLKVFISLIREGTKLKQVKITFSSFSEDNTGIKNPFNMNPDNFSQYIINKRIYVYYNKLFNELPDGEDKDAAEEMMLKAHTINTYLRNFYNIDNDTYTYESLVEFQDNPLGFTNEDYINYMVNKRIWLLWYEGHPSYTEGQAIEANNDNNFIRNRYLNYGFNFNNTNNVYVDFDMDRDGIAEEVDTSTYTFDDINYFDEIAKIYGYRELKGVYGDNGIVSDYYIINPPGMYNNDLVIYINNKKEWINIENDGTLTTQEKRDLQIPLEEENEALRDKYYIEITDAGSWLFKEHTVNIEVISAPTADGTLYFYLDNYRSINIPVTTSDTISTVISYINDGIDNYYNSTLNDPDIDVLGLKTVVYDDGGTGVTLNTTPSIGTDTYYDDTIDGLEPYIQDDDKIYAETVLFNVLITLNYNVGGYLENVVSETL